MENEECGIKKAGQQTCFCIPPSTFCIPHSTFHILHSTFCIPHSAFLILHSTFCIPHSTFCIPPAFHIPLRLCYNVLESTCPLSTRSSANCTSSMGSVKACRRSRAHSPRLDAARPAGKMTPSS